MRSREKVADKASLREGLQPASTCTSFYGPILGPGDSFCKSATTTVCRMAVLLNTNTCNWFCSQAGGTCLGTLDNADVPCTATGVSTCSTVAYNAICTCSLPGSGAPVTCTDRFPDGIICAETNGTCTVDAALNGTSCASYCSKGGYKCLSAISTTTKDPICKGSGADSCTTIAFGEICVCGP